MGRSNKPLTLEQLKQMDRYPVWVEDLEHPEKSQWRLLYWDRGKYLVLQGISLQGYLVEDYGKTWVAYAQQPAHIDREKWGPCEHCKPAEYPPDYYGPHSFPIVGNEIYFYDTDDGWEGEEIKFCPWCGRPLTEAAWAELERRLLG